MNALHEAGLALAAGLLTACATIPARVPLEADPRGATLLQGDWVGEYSSPETGRSGSITLSVIQHADSTICRGDVLMVPRGSSEPLPPAEGWAIGRPDDPGPRVLQIEKIRVSGEQVSGTIEPYRDPDTGHSISTSFDGIIAGDRITGTLLSVDAKTGERAVGRWEAIRKKSG